MMDCGICKRIQQIQRDESPHFIAEFQTGYAVLGDHQLFRGYALLLHKEHKAELHELSRAQKMAFLEEMSIVAEAVHTAFKPQKLNVELLGNSLSHMHWHIFPRRADDLAPTEPVWVVDKSIRYGEAATPSSEDQLALKRDLLEHLQRLAADRMIRSFA